MSKERLGRRKPTNKGKTELKKAIEKKKVRVRAYTHLIFLCIILQ
jgi:hypothetical protein